MSYMEQMHKIVGKYRGSHQPWPATAVDIARWAIRKKLWEIHPSKIARQCADQIAEAMRQEYITGIIYDSDVIPFRTVYVVC